MTYISNITLKLEQTKKTPCYHCGDICTDETVTFENKFFCCHGCKSVFELLQSCNLDGYYKYADNPGIKQLKAPVQSEYAYLDNSEIAARILDFSSEKLAKVKFRIPVMHCASCIWLLENFRKLVPGVLQSRVNFLRREVQFSYDPSLLSLRKLVEQLAAIGYAPELNLESVSKKNTQSVQKRLIYQIAVAGFCFGNIMLLSFPEYIAGSGGVNETYRSFFGYLNFVLALPVLLYSARDYLTSGWRAVRTRHINMDIPISLGILALFLRSTFEIFFEGGGGYMDSLAALLFFLLIGKWIQQKTYDNLSFERDYKSYFPIAVQVLQHDEEIPRGIDQLVVGDRYRVRSGELIPADAILIDGQASIDYSFVSGESDLTFSAVGEKIYAGGRQSGVSLILEVLKPVDQSYLTSLWNSGSDTKEEHKLELLADRVGRNFTIAVVFIAIATGVFWLIRDPSIAINAVSAVLIVACPCALALSFPFALGNGVRLLGRHGFYFKSTQALAKMAEVTAIVFDKTGTLTRKGETKVSFEGEPISDNDLSVFAAMTAQSAHPLSRAISIFLKTKNTNRQFDSFCEIPGAGIEAAISDRVFKLGTPDFAGVDAVQNNDLASRIYLSVNKNPCGYFKVDKHYHQNLEDMIGKLKKQFKLFLLSGDGDSERNRMEKIFGQKEGLHFNQSPHSKKTFLRNLKKSGEITAMVGDGLNDSGALTASNFGVAVADDVFRFTPASDAVLTSGSFPMFDRFFDFSKSTLQIVKASFLLSFLYNGIGIMFAVQGLLKPVVAAVLMPLSSVSVVLFVTLGTRLVYRKYFPSRRQPDENQFL